MFKSQIQNVQISDTKYSNSSTKMREKCTEKGRVLKPRKPNEEQ